MQTQQRHYNVIGLMSGTSLDGLDVSLCTYSLKEGRWTYSILKAKTYPYNNSMVQLLNRMKDTSITDYLKLNIRYSDYVCQQLTDFLNGVDTKIDLISSHGHTILHQPHNLISLQCCDPTYIAAKTGIDCVGNFRQLDIYRGGQGAPLVPYGAQLFPQYSVFLNFGGVANIDYRGIGWDIGFCNMLSNYCAKKLGLQYDRDGDIGSRGKLSPQILEVFRSNKKLISITDGKSFSREDFQVLLKEIQSVGQHPQQDILFTHYMFLAELILQHINQLVRHKISNKIRVLCTGGGAYNKHLIGLLNTSDIEFVVPSSEIVEFKQAIVFGFLGVKFIREQQNCSRGVGGSLAKGRVY